MQKVKKYRLGCVWIILGILIYSVSACSPVQAADKFKPVPIHNVTVGGEIGRRIDVTVNNNLLVLDIDKDFLAPFQNKNRKEGYIGIGKLIDSFVRFAAYTNNPDLIKRKKYLISQLIKTQDADGYIGYMLPEHRMWALWDIHEMSYIIYGLVHDYRFFGEQQSLDAATRLADYIISKWSAEPQKKPGKGFITVFMAVTGMENALLAIYDATGQKRYIDTCTGLRKLGKWRQKIVLGRCGKIEGHAYAHICRCIAQLRLYRIHRDAGLMASTRKVIDFLTERDGLVITGGCGDHECWHDTQEGTVNLAETCATSYLVRLMDELLRLKADSRYGDIMERSIYNSLFAAQSPNGRQIRYYTPFEGPRSYFPHDTYCCPCNYRRIIAELPRMIYYRTNSGIAVNLYTTSTAKIELDDSLVVTLNQKTDYPSSGKVDIRLDMSKKARFPLQLRIPKWAAKTKVTVNDKPVSQTPKPGSFLSIKRLWKSGDRVELNLPLPFRFIKGRQAQAGRVAIMRGPVVFCLKRDNNKQLADINLNLIVIDPNTLEKDPTPDNSLRPGGLTCRISGWTPGTWYPTKHNIKLTLTEFIDPNGQATYFKVPNPNAKEFTNDELCQTKN